MIFPGIAMDHFRGGECIDHPVDQYCKGVGDLGNVWKAWEIFSLMVQDVHAYSASA
jgi:hypothetical protein